MLKSKLMILTATAGLAALTLTGCPANPTNDNRMMNTNTMNSNMGMANNAMNANMMNSNMTNGNMSNMSGSVAPDDAQFMTAAAQGGMMEVKMGELAASKSSNQEVKAFGSRMVADHGKANNDLKELAAKKGVLLPADMSGGQKADYDKLSKLSGAEFDKEYVSMMVEDHKADLDEFQDQADDAKDADLKAFAGKYAPIIKSHYETIKGIKDKMK